MPSLVSNWDLDGFVDEQRYYCSEIPIDPENLPVPKAVLTGDVRSYTDSVIEIGKTYYIRVGSVKNGVEKLSAEASVTSASDPNWNNVVSYLRFNGNFNDEKGNIWNQSGTVEFDDLGKFDKSAIFNGTGNYLSSADDAKFNLIGVFTIEFFAKISPFGTGFVEGVIFANKQNSWNSNVAYIGFRNNRFYIGGSTTSADFYTDFDHNNYVHYCIMRDSSNVVYGYKNGVLISSKTYSNPFNFGAGGPSIGHCGWSASVDFIGKLDEFRITKNILRYSLSGFTPPTM